jgi:hypothetical protein
MKKGAAGEGRESKRPEEGRDGKVAEGAKYETATEGKVGE